MAGLINSELKEGDIFCRWLKNRLIENNKNVLGAELGATGSGKSYRDLRKFELWYKLYLKREWNPDNICFGIKQVMRRLNSGELKRGDIIILEEAGANLGSLDFQNKVSKLFTYVLQSFRSMNVGIFFNLPYLSMLNKQARLLLHYSSESCGIDFDNKKNKCKFFFHQVNQGTGKIYKKYPKVKVQGITRTIKRLNYTLPDKRLIEIYEQKKEEYLKTSIKNYEDILDELDGKNNNKRVYPTEIEYKTWHLRKIEKRRWKEISQIIGKSEKTCQRYFDKVEFDKKMSEKN